VKNLSSSNVGERSKSFAIAVCLILGVLQGLALARYGIKGIALTAGLLYFYSLLRWPHAMLVLVLVALFDGFGLIDPYSHFRIPGLFQLKDLLFASLLAPLLLQRQWSRRAGRVFRASRVILVPVLAMLALTTLQMLRTSLQFELPLKSCVMAGRHFWYYALVPLAAIYVDGPRKQNLVYRLFLVLVSMQAVVMLTQTLVLLRGGGRFLAENVLIMSSSLGGFVVQRPYLVGEPALVLGFSLAFWSFTSVKSGRLKLHLCCMAAVCALAILLVNSRMRWLHAGLVVLIPMLFYWRRLSRLGRSLSLGACTALLAMTLLSAYGERGPSAVQGLTRRAFSAWTDFRNKEGTWEYRMDDNRFRFELIRLHPVIGLGTVHPDYAWRFGAGELVRQDDKLAYKRGITSTDMGIVDLLIQFGLAGALWATWYLVSVLRFCGRLLPPAHDETGLLRAAPLPLAAYMVGGLLTFVTLGLFTMPGDIVSHSCVLGILAAGADTRAPSRL